MPQSSVAQNMLTKFRPLVQRYMNVEVEHIGNMTQTHETAIWFEGHLKLSAEEVYKALTELLLQHHVSLYLSRENKRDQILIINDVTQERTFKPPLWLHIILLMLTMLTTIFAAAMLYGYTAESLQAAILEQDRVTLLPKVRPKPLDLSMGM